ncbi:hypothetical protein DICVIV_09593 [Dictyocaulus viviparus]|uniref:Doublecortin domain-containing protein n=1 Tax=Dictyocaulus viviparus TaxID=29172 RepID=A0A0D8XKS3_DICVI|nr:hypothetical protein DICVIV_09593 [Dictyocaulus viviparus]
MWSISIHSVIQSNRFECDLKRKIQQHQDGQSYQNDIIPRLRKSTKTLTRINRLFNEETFVTSINKEARDLSSGRYSSNKKFLSISYETRELQGVRVPVSKSRYRTFDRLLDDLNENIQMPFGVRRLTTPMGRTSIHNIEDLQHLGNSYSNK